MRLVAPRADVILDAATMTESTRGCLMNGWGAKEKVSSGAKAQFLPDLNVGAEAPTPVAAIYEMAATEARRL